ncbi:hypothetical protein [Streptomyces lasiicapitis]|uniref:MYXO-CTERM domain-containing protein n=1 Tax=Streptomyces lasiicapitis TaxID=1923961 RepID=A0ABQ2MMK8_9ACTN|nr:hypothetical protein [Streptomyces lasiicapitis]GGO54548.1 hypothetical protein GCM10012286_64570 [Streptomyces lasiicapitis]
MINFTRSSVRGGVAAIAGSVLLLGQPGAAHADQLPFEGRGYASVDGPAGPGQLVELTVKERPGNPRPTSVDVTSPALTSDTAMGDTGRAWVGAGRIKPKTRPGTYEVKFTLRHKNADCVGEGEQDYLCDYPAIVLRERLTVTGAESGEAKDGADGDSDSGSGFGRGVAVGAASAAAAGGLLGGVLVWNRRRRERAGGASS